MGRAICRIIAVAGLAICVPALIYAENVKPKEPKGLDVASDTAITVIQKTNAFFQGNLEITMSGDKDKYKKSDYTVNAMGVKVPKSTDLK